MLTETGEDRVSRMTYDRGTLEIMTSLMPHERANRHIERLIWILVEELGLNLLSVGSMTCKREELVRGAEPDSSYYIQNVRLDERTGNLFILAGREETIEFEIDNKGELVDEQI